MKYTGKDADEFLEKREIILEIQEGGKTEEEKTELRKKRKTLQRLRTFLDGFNGKTRDKVADERECETKVL